MALGLNIREDKVDEQIDIQETGCIASIIYYCN
jgi:hypothetical protein